MPTLQIILLSYVTVSIMTAVRNASDLCGHYGSYVQHIVLSHIMVSFVSYVVIFVFFFVNLECKDITA